MCLAIPMKIIEVSALKDEALAVVDGQERVIDILLLDDVQKDDWVLVLSKQAIKKIDAIEANEVKKVMQAILKGQDFGLSEPQLPPHLQQAKDDA
ncbi:MAG: HypC/HybG/HupF family hydrogenase formation chaperone [Alphaproteobacteria bacterium]